MNISSLVIYAQPQRANDVRAELEQLSGVEVHAVTAEGRIVVTVEKRDDREMAQAFEQMSVIPGVQATTLVYSHSETFEGESPAKKESNR